MKNDLSIILDHRSGNLHYRERLIYNIRDEYDNQLLRVAVHIGESSNKLVIFSTGIRADAPLPAGISSQKYFDVLSTFVKQGDLGDISYSHSDRPNEYLVQNNQEVFILASSAEDPEYEEEIAKWLEKLLDKDSVFNNIMDMFDSIRNDSV